MRQGSLVLARLVLNFYPVRRLFTLGENRRSIVTKGSGSGAMVQRGRKENPASTSGSCPVLDIIVDNLSISQSDRALKLGTLHFPCQANVEHVLCCSVSTSCHMHVLPI